MALKLDVSGLAFSTTYIATPRICIEKERLKRRSAMSDAIPTDFVPTNHGPSNWAIHLGDVYMQSLMLYDAFFPTVTNRTSRVCIRIASYTRNVFANRTLHN